MLEVFGWLDVVVIGARIVATSVGYTSTCVGRVGVVACVGDVSTGVGGYLMACFYYYRC